MGSAASSAASRTAARRVSRPPNGPVNRNVRPRANEVESGSEASTQADPVTARLQRVHSGQRMSPGEWSDLLKNISGAISSSSWEGEVQSPSNPDQENERHSAQRSEKATVKLPIRSDLGEGLGKRQLAPDRDMPKLEGRLTQNQVLALFNLRRKDSKAWTKEKIAERFEIEEQDVENLLRFSRTYVGRIDEDGQMRGYYKADEGDTIVGFERD